jgi:hypothetical protein
VKKIVLALAVAVATVAVANAQTPASKPAPKTTQTAPGGSMAKPGSMAKADAKAAKAKAASMKAEVVSTDAAAKTITVKDASGANMTLTASGGAVAALATVKAGDWVTVTHTDTTATKIAKVKATTAAPKKDKK